MLLRPRVGTIAVVALAVVVVSAAAVALLGGRGGDYVVHMEVENAGQLVKGNLVQVGGVSIGSVDAIELADDNVARIDLRIDDKRFQPLHRGTRAAIRATSLSSVAGRVVALEPGPDNAPAIPDGGVIPRTDSQSIVDLDALLNTLDLQTRRALQGVVHDSASLYASDTGAANRGLAALNPALSRTRALTDELLRDRRTFERFIVQSASVVQAVAGRSADLEAGLASAARTAGAVAGETDAIDRTLRAAPATLRRSNTTLVNVRSALADLRPALRDSRVAAPRLRKVLQVAAPLARSARPVVRDTNALLPTARRVLRGLPALQRAASPAFAATVSSVTGSLPIVAALKYYLPDTLGGLIAGFGGSNASYYDANGHYARISANVDVHPAVGIGSAVNVPQPKGTSLDGLRSGVVARCPGAATQRLPDGSNPYRPPAVAWCAGDQAP